MIIGNNNNNFNNNTNFQKKIDNNSNIQNDINNKKSIEEKPKKKGFKNIFTDSIFSLKGNNTNNSNDMYDKSLAMLNDRLEKGTISLDEFNKKCREISKKRNKQ